MWSGPPLIYIIYIQKIPLELTIRYGGEVEVEVKWGVERAAAHIYNLHTEDSSGMNRRYGGEVEVKWG